MLEILKRLEERGSDEVEEGGSDEGEEGGATQSLEERLAGLDLEDSEVVWQQLTLSEKKEFQELVKSGRMGHLLSVYTPWWEVRVCGCGVRVWGVGMGGEGTCMWVVSVWGEGCVGEGYGE